MRLPARNSRRLLKRMMSSEIRRNDSAMISMVMRVSMGAVLEVLLILGMPILKIFAVISVIFSVVTSLVVQTFVNAPRAGVEEGQDVRAVIGDNGVIPLWRRSMRGWRRPW